MLAREIYSNDWSWYAVHSTVAYVNTDKLLPILNFE